MTLRRGVAVGLAFVAVAALAIGVVTLTSSGSGGSGGGSDAAALRGAVVDTTPAGDPFSGLTQTSQIAVGGVCRRLVVADSETERVEGLRQRSDLGDYDGMLFAFGGPTDVGFTMSTVPVALDIGFYRADGSRVAARRMQPCPKAENQCPVYDAGAPFTYALETLKGKLPAGGLSGRTCHS